MKLRSVPNAVEAWKWGTYPMLPIGEAGKEPLGSVLDGREESLHTSVVIVVMWNFILKSKEIRC
jgi:hypothetical protein